MFRVSSIFNLSLLFLLTCSERPKDDFQIVKSLVKNQVLSDSETYVNAKPITVTEHISERSVGTKHDFYSEGDYWWPNPKHPDSAYIRKDGLTNPDNFVDHRLLMIRLSQISGNLASAYLVTKDKKFLDKLLPHLKAWFVNKETMMNPNLLFAQAIHGRVTGRGIGIIDTIHLVEVALAVEVLEASQKFPEREVEPIKDWFSKYLKWLTTHPYGITERDNGNNHSTCWALQVAAFARLTGNIKKLDFCRNLYKNVLLPTQMASNGSFPKELSRTKPYGYSIFNLDAMASVAQLLTSNKDNLFKYETLDGKSLKRGLQFLYPYLKDKFNWPYKKDVMYWEDWPTKQPSLLFGGLQLNKKEYIKTFINLPNIPSNSEVLRNMPVRNPVLWIKI